MSELLDAVDDLTRPKPVKVATDTGYTWATEDPLLDQLEDAIHSTMGRTGGRGGSSAESRMILDADALMRFAQIGSVIMDWCRMAGAVVVPGEPAANLRRWYDAYAASADLTALDVFYTTQLTKWANQIRAKLTPRETLEFTDPCPECYETVWVNEDGDLIPNPVTIEYDKNGDLTTDAIGTCRACGKTWTGLWELRALRHAADTLATTKEET